MNLLQGDLLADILGAQDVVLDLRHHRRQIKGDPALEVQVKAAEIDVGGAHHRGGVVRDKHLGVDEARRVLKDAHPRLQKLLVVGAGHHVDIPLVRHIGGDDPHVHPALRRQADGGEHLVVQNQVGRGDVDVPPRVVENLHVDVLGQVAGVQGAVAIGLHITRTGSPFGRQKVLQLQRLVAGELPQLQKHLGQALHRLAAQQHGGVLPVAVFFLLIDVFVGQVDAAGEADVAVDDADFAVIAVVGGGVELRVEGVKDPYLKALLPQIVGVEGRQGGHTANVVVHDADLHAVVALLLENLENRIPHLARMHDEVFQQDELFGPAQLLQQPFIEGFSAGEILRLGVFIQHKAGAVLDISRLPSQHGIVLLQTVQGSACGLGGQQLLTVVAVKQGAGVALDLAGHVAAVALHAEHQVKDAAH